MTAVADTVAIARSAPVATFTTIPDQIIMNEYPFAVVMDARQFDRIADRLAQLHFLVSRIQTQTSMVATQTQEQLVRRLQECLELNDRLGRLSEKGLI